MTTYLAWGSLLASLAFFAGVGAYALDDPGLQYDEAFDAVPALEVLAGLRPGCADSTRLFGPDLPLMLHPHIGPTSVYTSLAGFALLGPSVESLRLSQLLVGAVALVLVFLLARAWFDDRVAAIAALLCGTAPAFVWWSRGGANWTVPMLPLALGTLLALTRWWRTRRTAPLAVAGLLLGLGVTTKILFVWLALPMALTALVALGPRAIAAVLRQTSWPTIAAALGGLLVGLAPLIAHNVPEPHTFHHVARSAVTTAWGHDNRDFLANVGRAVGSFLAMIDGDVLMATPTYGHRVGPVALGLAVLYGAASLLARLRGRERPRGGLARRIERSRVARTFLVLVPVTVLPQSAITTSVISATYVFLIVPLVWLLVAVMLGDAVALGRAEPAARRHRLVAAAGVALAVLLLAVHVKANVGLLRFFARTGGLGQWSDAIYRTTGVLETRYPSRHVVALDWGFARSIELLTSLRVRVTEGHEFLPAPSERYREQAARLVAEPGTILLAHAEDIAVCRGCFAVVQRVAAERGIELALRHVVRDREGRPHTMIYEVGESPGPAAERTSHAGEGAVLGTARRRTLT